MAQDKRVYWVIEFKEANKPHGLFVKSDGTKTVILSNAEQFEVQADAEAAIKRLNLSEVWQAVARRGVELL